MDNRKPEDEITQVYPKMSFLPSPPFSSDHQWAPTSLDTILIYPHLTIHSSTATSFLLREVSVSRLNLIHKHLWIAGQKRHIRPFHRQLMLRRELVITEDPSMHLVWFENTIFLKPIPEALLNAEFWERFICIEPNEKDAEGRMSRGRYYEAACGFLLSYTKLIERPSDYRIAVEYHLIPDMGFHKWHLLAQDLLASTSSQSGFVPENRWEYGELRLSRLNWIYKLTFRGYSYFYVFTEYSTYFGKNFQMLVLGFAYSSVALAAMQVVVSSQDPSNWLVGWCFRFSVAVILFMLFCVMAVVGLFIGLFSFHLVLTLYQHRIASTPVKVA